VAVSGASRRGDAEGCDREEDVELAAKEKRILEWDEERKNVWRDEE
jgi:hypothetical protein